MKEEILKKLECFIDPLFQFDPKLHRYTYDGEPMQSVTKTIEKFHEKFDTEAVAKKTSEKTGVDAEILKEQWVETNRYANVVGTELHSYIENYYNKQFQEIPLNLDVVDRINKFNKIHAQKISKLEPLKFEVRIFSKKWKIAGTIDALFFRNGKIYILDWKSNKKFTHDDHQDGKWQKLLDPFGDFYKNHHNEYSIQLCLYAAILEQWGIDIAGAYIVYIGPGDEDAKLIKVKDMRPILKEYFDSI